MFSSSFLDNNYISILLVHVFVSLSQPQLPKVPLSPVVNFGRLRKVGQNWGIWPNSWQFQSHSWQFQTHPRTFPPIETYQRQSLGQLSLKGMVHLILKLRLKAVFLIMKYNDSISFGQNMCFLMQSGF